MSDFHEYVTEIAVVSDSLSASWDAKTHERATATDRITAKVGVRMSELAAAGDAIRGTVIGRTVERASMRDAHRGLFARHALMTERARVRDALRVTMGAAIVESAVAQDSITAGTTLHINEAAIAKDSFAQVGIGVQMADRLRTRGQAMGAVVARLHDAAQGSDAITGESVARLSDVAQVIDVARGTVMARVLDRGRAKDVLTGRLSGARLADKGKAKDAIGGAHVARLAESAQAADALTAQVSVTARIADVVMVTEQWTGALLAVGRIAEKVAAKDVLWAKYSATGRIVEIVYAQDEIGHAARQGMAWTAPVHGWAMSRYDSFDFDSITTVNGMAYGASATGVFALEGGSEQITARLTTGKLDLGRGALCHPMHAYLEYELDGTATMAVTQTQGGAAAQTWRYQLDQEPAAHLTNGRFTFGRGLRGRHFAFDLTMVGKRAHIDDLSVMADATKRRV